MGTNELLVVLYAYGMKVLLDLIPLLVFAVCLYFVIYKAVKRALSEGGWKESARSEDLPASRD